MAVLFDLDGTLIDTVPDFVTSLNEILQQQNLPLTSYQAIKPIASLGSSGMIEAAFKISPTNPEFEPLQQRFIVNYSKTDYTATKPFPGVETLLTQLEQAAIPWGIVTNKPGWLTNPLLEALNLHNRCKCVVSGDTTEKNKPDPEPLLYASKLLNTEPENCIYIGDAKRDIIAGNAAGMYTITALFGYIPDQSTALSWPANYKVSQVEEIFPIVHTWHKQKRFIKEIN